MKGGKTAAGVQALPCVILGQEVRLRPEFGSNDRSSSQAEGSTAHLSSGPPATQEGRSGPGFPGLNPGEGKDPVGEGHRRRKVKRALSDSSPASGSPGMRLAISFSPVLYLVEPSLAQPLNDKPEPKCA